MKDLRELMKDQRGDKVRLPAYHRDDFICKLKGEKPSIFGSLWKIAAAILVLVAMGGGYFSLTNNEDKNESQSQFTSIEQQYLNSIEQEYQNFRDLSSDPVLLKRYESQLDALKQEYNDLMQLIEENGREPYLTERLIDNLEKRLDLLRNIQSHIKILNEQNETI